MALPDINLPPDKLQDIVDSSTEYMFRLDNLRDDLMNRGTLTASLSNQIITEKGNISKHLTELATLSERIKQIADGELNQEEVSKVLDKIRSKETQLERVIESLETKLKDAGFTAAEVLNLFSDNQGLGSLIMMQDEFSKLNEDAQNHLEVIAGIEKKYKGFFSTGKMLAEGFGRTKIPFVGSIIDGVLDGVRAQLQKTRITPPPRLNAAGMALPPIPPGWVAKILGGLGDMGAFVKGFAGSFFKPLALIAGAIQLVNNLIDSMFEKNKQIVDLQRTIILSRDEAEKLRDNIANIKLISKEGYLNEAKLIQAQLSLNEEYGVSIISTAATLRNQVMLTDRLGLSVKEASTLNKMFSLRAVNSAIDLKNVELQRRGIMNVIANYANANGLLFNTKTIFSEIANVNTQIYATYKGNNEQLAKGVLEAKALGLNLDKAKEISESFLNFESSITSELEAELLTGRSLNFERARALALQGKYVEAVKDVMPQIGSWKEFTNMNVIAQQSIAKSIGMNKEGLAEALFEQENLSFAAQEYLKTLTSTMDAEGVRGIKRRMLTGENLEKIKQELTAQELFNESMNRLKEILVDLVNSGAVEAMSSALQNTVKFLERSGLIDPDAARKANKSNEDIAGSKSYTKEQKLKAAQLAKEINEEDIIVKGVQKQKDDESWIRKLAQQALLGPINISTQIGREAQQFWARTFRDNKQQELQDIKLSPKQDDFILKGDTVTPFRKDDLIIGGTSLGKPQDNKNVEKLLTELLVAVKSGGDVYLDSKKVGNAFLLANYKVA